MSALTDRIAAEHQPTRTSACTCGGMQLGEYYPLHIAAVAEAAVRERVARDIVQRQLVSTDTAAILAYDDAARIARGGAA